MLGASLNSSTFLQTLPQLVTYATEGALFISPQLSTDAVSDIRKVLVPIKLWKQHSAQSANQRLFPSTHVNMRRVRPGLKTKQNKKH